METLLQSIVLGVIQGITEFVPVSSSGHLVVFPRLFGWETQPLAFDTVLHLGTATALIIYFWQDLWSIISSFFDDVFSGKKELKEFSDYGKLGFFVILGSLPAGIAGFFLEDFIEKTYRGITSVMVFLIFGSALMFVAEKLGNFRNEVLTTKKSFIIGIFQALALFPGVSRSGATISAGMLFGLARDEAAKFSFLLSIPIVIGAAVFKLAESGGQIFIQSTPVAVVGYLTSLIVGLVTIKFLLSYLRKNSLYVFVFYRIILISLLLLVSL
jgi:undecaprenyl-diphosphatase